MNDWSDGEIEIVPSARHELMMETPEIRSRFFDRTCALFDAHP
jgi:lysophospholipase